MKKMKYKLMLVGFLFSIGSVINVYFSSLIHFQLQEGRVTIQKLKLEYCLKSIVSEHRHLTLFLCLDAVVLLIVSILVFTNKDGMYSSSMKRITTNIETPVVAGQGQHGSAKWLEGKELKKAFVTVTIDQENKTIKELIDRGYDSVYDKNKTAKRKRPRKTGEKPKNAAKQKAKDNTQTRPISIVSKGWDSARIERGEE